MKLTKTQIDGFVYQGPAPRRDVRWDTAVPGFGVRIYPSGKKSFVLSYRLKGRKRLSPLPSTALSHWMKRANEHKGDW